MLVGHNTICIMSTLCHPILQLQYVLQSGKEYTLYCTVLVKKLYITFRDYNKLIKTIINIQIIITNLLMNNSGCGFGHSH
jgi:hypothetical protein